MSENTPRLALPLLAAGQAQKHVTHNDALMALDALVQLSVRGRRSAPPTPSEGLRVIVDAGAVGAFAGQEGALAHVCDGVWLFAAPQPGWRAWVEEEARLLVFDGHGWAALRQRETDRLGIAATADAATRLAVSSEAVLFNHDGGDMRLFLNKAAPPGSAGLLLQSGFAGRAELALAGDDDVRLKVSADGAGWKQALVADRATGFVGLAGAPPLAPLALATDGTGLGAGAAAILVQGGVGAERAEFRSVAEAGPNAAFQGFGARGSVASPAPTRAGDRFFAVLGSGYDGASFVVPLAAQIDMVASGDWSGSSHGSAILFRTTPDGATTAARAERMRILANGNVRIGEDGEARSKLDVDGPVRVGSYPVAALPGAGASGAGAIVFVGDEAGGPVLAFSDGTNWRRSTDRAIVT